MIASADNRHAPVLASEFIEIEARSKDLLPICGVIPLQLLAYSMAVAIGLDVDRPRNLSKAVLIE